MDRLALAEAAHDWAGTGGDEAAIIAPCCAKSVLEGVDAAIFRRADVEPFSSYASTILDVVQCP